MSIDQTQQNLTASSHLMRIVVTAGRHQGAEVTLQRPFSQSFLVGSHLECDLVISDDGVASLHALIFEQSEQLWIKAAPGCSDLFANGNTVTQQAVMLERDMVFRLGEIASLKVEGNSLPVSNPPELKTHISLHRVRRSRGRARAFAALGCIACSAVLAVLTLSMNDSSRAVVALPEGSFSSDIFGKLPERANPDSLESVAQQISRYLGDPGVKVTARPPNHIEVAGIARSAATRGQLKKIQTALPKGVEISSTVSYPEDKVAKIVAPLLEQQMSKLEKKITQVASSERVPYIEIKGGARVFEGGQLNGYELLKITPTAIVARRDNQIETFKVE